MVRTLPAIAALGFSVLLICCSRTSQSSPSNTDVSGVSFSEAGISDGVGSFSPSPGGGTGPSYNSSIDPDVTADSSVDESPQRRGACCFPVDCLDDFGGVCCRELSADRCVRDAGVFIGDLTVCAFNTCEILVLLAEDNDNDGRNDLDEIIMGADPFDPVDGPDIDGDGVDNGDDSDVDGDGIDNGDDDDVDGDGIDNEDDSDVDGDGIDNEDDSDADGDGFDDGDDTDTDSDSDSNDDDGNDNSGNANANGNGNANENSNSNENINGNDNESDSEDEVLEEEEEADDEADDESDDESEDESEDGEEEGPDGGEEPAEEELEEEDEDDGGG